MMQYCGANFSLAPAPDFFLAPATGKKSQLRTVPSPKTEFDTKQWKNKNVSK